MSSAAPCSRLRRSPLGQVSQVGPAAVQAMLRRVFARWGLPSRLRVDNGPPWGSWGDLPPDLALWLIGLGITVVWNRPGHPQENGVVERGQGVCQQWVEARTCPTLAVLQARLARACVLQRERYPVAGGRSRLAADPGLGAGGAAYTPAHEAQQWELARVGQRLARGLWRRRVDKVGRISLYNRSVAVGRRYARQEVQVRFDAAAWSWVVLDEAGEELRRQGASELTAERIPALQVARRRPRAAPTDGANPAVARPGG